MPKPIKIGLSLIVFVLALLGHVFRDVIGMAVGPVYLICFAVFVVAALWVFPDPTKKQISGGR